VSEERPGRIDCVLIAGGKYHDIDFARLELLKLLAEDMRVRVRVFEDYENLAALKAADMIVSYTCDVTPSLAAQECLRRWVEKGGRWYALHGTNSILRFLESGLVDTPDERPDVMAMLGTQFVAHPPIGPFKVQVKQPEHPRLPDLEQRGYSALGVMDRHLAEHEYFAADALTIADLALFAYTHKADEAGFDLSPYPAVRAWLTRVAAAPGVSVMPSPAA